MSKAKFFEQNRIEEGLVVIGVIDLGYPDHTGLARAIRRRHVWALGFRACYDT